MEGIGSRLGRVSSRYGGGPAPSAPVFNGRVRKWKRQWVLCQSDNVANGKGHGHHKQNPPPLLLCRWTPLPSTTSDESSINPPKRKFRYTPVIVLEEKKKEEAFENVGDEAEASVAARRNMSLKKPVNDDFMEEVEEISEDQAYLDRGHLDLQLCLEKPQ